MAHSELNKKNIKTTLIQGLKVQGFGCSGFLSALTVNKIIKYSTLLRQTRLGDYEMFSL